MERSWRWLDAEGVAEVDAGSVSMVAPPMSDWFHDPGGATSATNAPVLVTPVDGDVWFVARVTTSFAASFDAGVIFVHQGDEDYAKLCFEAAPDGTPTVVSVVTRGVSDDANGPAVVGDGVWLRATRTNGIWAFHHSGDGRRWQLLRLFTLRDPVAPTTIGLCAQSPLGSGCNVVFDQLGWASMGLADPRDGS